MIYLCRIVIVHSYVSSREGIPDCFWSFFLYSHGINMATSNGKSSKYIEVKCPWFTHATVD